MKMNVTSKKPQSNNPTAGVPAPPREHQGKAQGSRPSGKAGPSEKMTPNPNQS